MFLLVYTQHKNKFKFEQQNRNKTVEAVLVIAD